MRTLALLGASIALLVACSSDAPEVTPPVAAPSSSSTSPSTSTVVPAPASVTTAAEPVFKSSITAIDERLAGQMTPTSWREGCPVGLDDLRLLTVDHWDGGGVVVEGRLVIHADHAEAVAGVFETLFDERFPIARMDLVDVFGGDDGASMAANNTSAFNCRAIASQPGVWSQHAYGAAIDINPLVNPFVSGGSIDPPQGSEHADRSVKVPGGIYPDSVVVAAFEAIGWAWGGDWTSSKDYQHFSANGL